jgi:hypothetical protein
VAAVLFVTVTATLAQEGVYSEKDASFMMKAKNNSRAIYEFKQNCASKNFTTTVT